jgi:hypothetical protein
MLAIAAFALITVIGFGLVLAATVVVTIGVRQEERYRTLKHTRPPGTLAGLARVILGHYVRVHDDEPAAGVRPGDAIPGAHPDDALPGVHPDDAIPWYERSSGQGGQ